MSLLFYTHFKPSDVELNPNVFYVYVESSTEKGGTPDVVYLRNHSKGLPLTLLELYLPEGLCSHLNGDTYERDVRRIERQFQIVNFVLNNNGIVCLPTQKIQEQITYLERSSPKMAGYVLKRLDLLLNNFSPISLEIPT